MSTLIPSLAFLLEAFRCCFRQEVFQTFEQMFCGWLLCTGRRTVSRVWETTGLSAEQDHTRAFRLFSHAKWDWDSLGTILVRLVLKVFISGDTFTVVVDDTLCHKRGAKVAFGGIFLDAVQSSKSYKSFRFGNNWILLGIIVSLPCRSDRQFCVPVFFRLYRKKGLKDYRSRTQLASEMLQLLARIAPNYRIIVVCDTNYTGEEVLKHLPENVSMIGPVFVTARLHDPNKTRTYGAMADHAPMFCGRRFPTLKQLFASKHQWKKLRLLVKGKSKTIEIRLLDDVLWYRTAGKRRLRILLIRDPQGIWRNETLLSTNLDISPEQMIQQYTTRWTVELCFADSKQQLGFHDPMVRTKKAVARAHALSWFVGALVIIWYATEGYKLRQALRERPWYRHKKGPSFADMLATCRFHHWSGLLHSQRNPPCSPSFRWFVQYVSTGTFQ